MTSSRKYQGRHVAENYDGIRQNRPRWKRENEAVAAYLDAAKCRTVIDVACGTGRFFEEYRRRKMVVTGTDCSQAMLDVARRKSRRARLVVQDATDTHTHGESTFDLAVCVRLLNLLDEKTMLRVLGGLCWVALRAVVLTIALGDEYVPRKTTAVHSRAKFMRAVRKHGWRVAEERQVLKWSVIRLEA